jgi:outer membrane receptor protein involved in Fe transport
MSRSIAFLLVASLLLGTSLANGQSKEEPLPEFENSIVINGYRLSGSAEDSKKLPTETIIITKAEIEASPADTVQDLLQEQAGVIFYDNVGNGLQTTISLRGFNSGNSVAVYVDGVRVNEPQDNSAKLEFISLAAIERIEILPGGASHSRGSGATAGVINIILRKGEGAGWSSAAIDYGSFATTRSGFSTGLSNDKLNFFISGDLLSTDGFRENSAAKTRNGYASFSYHENSYDLTLSYRTYRGEMGNPGALTAEELAIDRKQSPYNAVDFSNSDENVFAIRYQQKLAGNMLLDAQSHYRTSTSEILTTGRNAALWGGFTSTAASSSKGVVAQISGALATIEYILGTEYERGDFGNIGHFTTAAGQETYLANDRDTEQTSSSFFANASMDIFDSLTLTGAMRHDKVEMAFSDQYANDAADTSFAETTAAFGGSLRLLQNINIYGRYAQSFQTPTVNDLFAFPLFGSNPDLLPTTGDTFEVGLKANSGSRYYLQLTAYRMNLENEVVFVITDPVWFIGSNENVGQSRREGISATFYGKPLTHVSIRASYAYTRSLNLSLAEDLNMAELLLPMVPKHKFSATADYSNDLLSASWTTLYIGEQVMDSDTANAGEMLEAYLISNLGLKLFLDKLELKLELRNLFDSVYSTRAFYSFMNNYFTPAPGRSFNAGLSYRF